MIILNLVEIIIMEEITFDYPHYIILTAYCKQFALVNKYLEAKYPNMSGIDSNTILTGNEIIGPDDNRVFIKTIIVRPTFSQHLGISYIIYVESLDDIPNVEKFLDYVEKFAEVIDSKIFHYDFDRQVYLETNETFTSANNLIGYDHYLKQLDNDIQAVKTKKELLVQLGSLSGRNYLLSGPPGTGKTTLVKTIAAKYNISLFIIKLGSCKELSHRMLAPTNAILKDGTYFDTKKSLSIILLEDFELYAGKNNLVMSNLLNALDGITNCYGMFRFFSLNNFDYVVKHKPLMTRMAHIMNFTIPEIDIVKEYLAKLFPSDENLDTFVNKINGHNITIREINNFVSRYALSDNPIESSLGDIDNWLQELAILEQKRINITNKEIEKEKLLVIKNEKKMEERQKKKDFFNKMSEEYKNINC